jgi:hypothetical protein
MIAEGFRVVRFRDHELYRPAEACAEEVAQLVGKELPIESWRTDGARCRGQNHEICLFSARKSRTSPSAVGSRRGISIGAGAP